ncbi:MAG: hypothetical protein JXQ99_15900 [Hyphomicrobiaceae bacterium]
MSEMPFASNISSDTQTDVMSLWQPPSTGPINRNHMSQVVDHDAAILIYDFLGANAARMRRQIADGYLLPTIDFTGDFQLEADLCFAPREVIEEAKIHSVVAAFTTRRHQLGQWARETDDGEFRLLAHLFVTARKLEARYAPQHASGHAYSSLLPVQSVQDCAERLANTGLLTREHFDRFHVCPRCMSSRLNVREECEKCRSSNVTEAALLHHYRCAYLGPADDFTAADSRLVCPKCRRELRHYGTDHERAGEAIDCANCRHFASAPAIGFLCLDCGSHCDAAAVGTRSVYHYALSSAAHDMLQSEVPPQPLRGAALHQSLPLDLISTASRMRRSVDVCDKAELVICEISYKDVAVRTANEEFSRDRRHFLEILRSELKSGMVLIVGAAFDYIIYLRISPDPFATVQQCVENAKTKLKQDFAVDLREIRADTLGL